MRRARGGLLAAALLAAPLLAGLGLVQAREVKGGEPGSFDFHVLALSWSPGFCALEGGERDAEQCAPGRGLRFVVHGLWPQFTSGYPTQCGAAERTPSRLALEEAKGLHPSEGLARHQWRRHGTCSGLDPAAYFRATRQARERVVVPESLSTLNADARLTPLEIERAFMDANPGLWAEGLSVVCRKGTFQEVRVCLSRDLRDFVTCPEVNRAGCRGGATTVGAPR